VPRGENVPPRAEAIATGPTPASSSPLLGALRISTCQDDREGEFHTEVFERYSRSEPEVAEALTQMFVSGTSTHKVGKVAEKLMGALCHNLTSTVFGP
jgi:putative transposase